MTALVQCTGRGCEPGAISPLPRHLAPFASFHVFLSCFVSNPLFHFRPLIARVE